VKQLKEGFQILWLGDICSYDGTCWTIGNTRMSVYEFGEALLATDPDDSMEAALLRMNDAPFPLGDDDALLSFLRLPAISYPLLFELGSLARYQAQRTRCNNAQKHPKKVCKLVAWRFDSATVNDELQRIIILTEWASGLNEEHRTLSWEPEPMLHGICKPLLLAFWQRVGGRDASIQIRGGRLGASSQYLVHAILNKRTRRRRVNRAAKPLTGLGPRVRAQEDKDEYLLEWVGYELPTWEDGDNVSEDLKQEFNAKA
jgi:hypothetical protein